MKANFSILLASFAVAVGMWTYVKSERTDMRPTTVRVRLETSATPNGLIAAEFPAEISVDLKGPADKIEALARRKDPIIGRIDLSQASKNVRAYRVNLYDYNEYVTEKPLTTNVTIEEVADKSMPVVLDTRGDLPDKDLVLKKPLNSTPSSVVVSGAKSYVDRVARVTGTVDLAAIDPENPKGMNVDLKLQDDQGQEIRQSDVVRVQPFSVTAFPTVMPAPVEKEFVVSATIEGAPAEGYVTEAITATPAKVILDGPSLTLAQLKRLSTERIDITNLRETKRFNIKLRLPANTQIKGNANRVVVEVRIRKVGPTPPATNP